MVTMESHMKTGMAGRVGTSVRVSAIALALMLGVTACGKNADDGQSTTTTTSIVTSTTLSPTDAPIVDGYRQFQAAYLAASDPMNPNDPRLAQHATGKELAQLRSTLLAFKSSGKVFRGTLDLAPKVLRSDAAVATIQDCYFDHTRVFDAKTGATSEPEDTQRQLIEASMVFEDGVWKVSAIDHKGEGCVAG